MLRKARIFYNWVQGYEFDDPQRNGEYFFLRSYISRGMVIFDVGANVGNFTEYVLSLSPCVEVHCFEPVAQTFTRLKERLADRYGKTNIVLNNFGLSDRQGAEMIKIYGNCAGTNSLYERRSAIAKYPSFAAWREETVPLTTLDAYLSENPVEIIDLLKIDVEGHELKVLAGASSALSRGKVRCIQFEYGGCFLDSGAKLEEIFLLLTQNGFDVFRLLPFGKLRIRSFHPYLENYKYSNWLAIRS